MISGKALTILHTKTRKKTEDTRTPHWCVDEIAWKMMVANKFDLYYNGNSTANKRAKSKRKVETNIKK